MRSNFVQRRRALAAAAVTGFAVVVAGIAYAAIPDADGTYHACVHHARGALRVIDPAVERCNEQTETAISFAARGHAGPAGPAGPAGRDGRDGVDGEPFSGTFTSPNGLYSLRVTDTGIVMTGDGSTIALDGSGITVQSGADPIAIRSGGALLVDVAGDTTVDLDGSLTLVAAGNASVDVDGALFARTGTNAALSVGGALTANVAGNTTASIGGALSALIGGAANIQASGPLGLAAAALSIQPGAGCRPAARAGDPVAGSAISAGSTTVCIG